MQNTRAIVLRIIRYADNRVIISFFTEHYGFISAVVRIKHGRNGGCPASLMQLLAEVEHLRKENERYVKIIDKYLD